MLLEDARLASMEGNEELLLAEDRPWLTAMVVVPLDVVVDAFRASVDVENVEEGCRDESVWSPVNWK